MSSVGGNRCALDDGPGLIDTATLPIAAIS